MWKNVSVKPRGVHLDVVEVDRVCTDIESELVAVACGALVVCGGVLEQVRAVLLEQRVSSH